MPCTRDALLTAAAGPRKQFRNAVKDVRTVFRVYREATDAKDIDGIADHSVRMAAARGLVGIYGLEAPRDQPGDTGPVNVAIILTTSDARTPLQADGLILHLAGGNGEKP